jgi:hypothetical protein
LISLWTLVRFRAAKRYVVRAAARYLLADGGSNPSPAGGPKPFGGRRPVSMHWEPSPHGASCARIKVKESEAMTGIQFVTDDKGRKTAVLIDLKKHRALWEDFWDGLVSESRRKEKSIPYQEYRANRSKRGRPRD